MTAHFILRDNSILRNAINALLRLDLKKPWALEIKEYKPQRTAAQNRLYWKWLGELSEQTGHDTEELHEYMKRRFLGAELKTILGVEIEVPKSTADLRVAPFAEFLTKIEVMAAQNGYTLTQPLDYRLAMYGEKT